jgi:catechol 2,3-dioxygenase-like lactoylglutathione lyase family enzyme
MVPTLTGIDHIHIYSKDREKAALWFQQTLGFKINEDLRFWATNNKGPLTVEDSCGRIHLALFNSDDFTPSTAVAFGCDGKSFLQWKAYLEASNLLNRCTDHKVTWSLYFSDPDGNSYEITSFDHEFITASQTAA